MPTHTIPDHRIVASLILSAVIGGSSAHASDSTNSINRFRVVAKAQGYLGHPAFSVELPEGSVLNPKLLVLHHAWKRLHPVDDLSAPGDKAFEKMMVALSNPRDYADLSETRTARTWRHSAAGETKSHECALPIGLREGDDGVELFGLPVRHEWDDASHCKVTVEFARERLFVLVDDTFERTDIKTLLAPETAIPQVLRENDEWRSRHRQIRKRLLLTVSNDHELVLVGDITNTEENSNNHTFHIETFEEILTEELGWARNHFSGYFEHEHPTDADVHEVVLAACGGDHQMAARVIEAEAQARAERDEAGVDLETLFRALTGKFDPNS